jgi:hypothetical protein
VLTSVLVSASALDLSVGLSVDRCADLGADLGVGLGVDQCVDLGVDLSARPQRWSQR